MGEKQKHQLERALLAEVVALARIDDSSKFQVYQQHSYNYIRDVAKNAGVNVTPYDTIVNGLMKVRQSGDALIEDICGSVDQAVEVLNSGQLIKLDTIGGGSRNI